MNGSVLNPKKYKPGLLLQSGGGGTSSTMAKTQKLIQKVKHLLRRAGLPRWLHRFGPKRYELWQHAVALLVREYCKLSFRRAKQLFDLLGVICPSKSALHYGVRRIPAAIWQRLLMLTTSMSANVVAIDGTTFARSQPSFHYLQRIDRHGPHGVPAKLSILIDTRTKKVLAARLRCRPAGDTKDVAWLLRSVRAKTLVADKGYDAEQVHEHLFYQGIKALIPLRKNARKGFFRMKASRTFNLRVYHRRSMVESVFSSLKRKFGTSLKCRTARPMRAEIFCRLILQNIISALNWRLRTEPFFP